MAYIFDSGKMVSDHNEAYITNAVFESAVKNGSFCVLGDLADDTTYDASGKEYDVYEAAAPAAVTDEVVVVDYAGINELSYAGSLKYGIKLYELMVPAGVATRVRRLVKHDKFWLAAGNFKGTPTKALAVGKYGILEANAYYLDCADAAPQAGFAVKILIAKDLTVGMKSEGKQYLCEVVQL